MKSRIAITTLLAVGVIAGVSDGAGASPPQGQTETIRTLDAINIEGEIAVPQVLFITSRDYRRYRDKLGSIYRKTALEVARPGGLPARVRVVATQGQLKEEDQ